MAKKRIYVPADESWIKLIKAIAKKMDRSEAWVSSQLLSDGIKFNMLTNYSLDPATDPIIQFKLTH